MIHKRIASEFRNLFCKDIGHLAREVLVLRLVVLVLFPLALPFLVLRLIGILFTFLSEKTEFMLNPFRKTLWKIDDNYEKASQIRRQTGLEEEKILPKDD